MPSKLSSSIKMPSGLVFKNRLVKAALAEDMAADSNPDDKYVTLYAKWGSGGWGSILTGNVEVSTLHKASPGTVALRSSISQATRDAWKRWALASQHNGVPTLVQISHPGRQSPAGAGERGVFSPSIAPSPIPLNIGSGFLERLLAKVLFGTPKEMTINEIEVAIQQFVNTAKLSYESGFQGVELHGAHGYLISSFLSPKTNVRNDAYGGTPAKRARFVIEIIRAIRAVVPSSFAVGVKLNSADVNGAENLEDSLEQVGLIAAESIDFLEISGGSYENPLMLAIDSDPKVQRSVQREAFFLDYAKAVRAAYPDVILMVTGGFRTRKSMEAALESGACDIIGIGRPAAVWPHFPKEVLLNPQVSDEDASGKLGSVRPSLIVRMLPIKLVGIGINSMYYAKQIRAMAVGLVTRPPPLD